MRGFLKRVVSAISVILVLLVVLPHALAPANGIKVCTYDGSTLVCKIIEQEGTEDTFLQPGDQCGGANQQCACSPNDPNCDDDAVICAGTCKKIITGTNLGCILSGPCVNGYKIESCSNSTYRVRPCTENGFTWSLSPGQINARAVRAPANMSCEDVLQVRDALNVPGVKFELLGRAYPTTIPTPTPPTSGSKNVVFKKLAPKKYRVVPTPPAGYSVVKGCHSKTGVNLLNHLARWTGDYWKPVGTDNLPLSASAQSAIGGGIDADDTVKTLVLSGSTLYAGGLFRRMGSVPVAIDPPTSNPRMANLIAKIDLSSQDPQWQTLSFGLSKEKTNTVLADATVQAIAVSGSRVYAGGYFTKICPDAECKSAGAAVEHGVAVWDGNAWHPLGTWPDGAKLSVVNSMVMGSDGTLYAGGYYHTSSALYGKVYKLVHPEDSGSQWEQVGVGYGFRNPSSQRGQVLSLELVNGTLYAGGEFSRACVRASDKDACLTAATTRYLAKYDDVNKRWVEPPGYVNDMVRVIKTAGSGQNDYYLGGDFTTAYSYNQTTGGRIAEQDANHIAKWNAASLKFEPLAQGANNNVYDMIVSGSNLYAAGRFTVTSGKNNERVAKWNGSSWNDWRELAGSPRDNLNGVATSVVIYDGKPIIGGGFSQISSVLTDPAGFPSVSREGDTDIMFGDDNIQFTFLFSDSCGNHICENGKNGTTNMGETCLNCPTDCGECPPSSCTGITTAPDVCIGNGNTGAGTPVKVSAKATNALSLTFIATDSANNSQTYTGTVDGSDTWSAVVDQTKTPVGTITLSGYSSNGVTVDQCGDAFLLSPCATISARAVTMTTRPLTCEQITDSTDYRRVTLNTEPQLGPNVAENGAYAHWYNAQFSTSGALYTIAPETVANMTPYTCLTDERSGSHFGQASAFLTPGDQVQFDIAYGPLGPWVQTFGGNVYAHDTIFSQIPDTLISSYFSENLPNGTHGIVTVGMDINGYDFTTAPPPDMGENKVSVNKWVVNDQQEKIDWASLFMTQVTNRTTVTPITENLSALPQPGAGIYQITGDVTTSGNWTVGDGQQYIFLVNGNLTLGGNVNITDDNGDGKPGFITFIVKGNITVSPTVGNAVGVTTPNIEGFYVATDGSHSGTFATGYDETSAVPRLVIKGSVVADVVVPQRDVGDYNVTRPAEQYIYNPALLVVMPDVLKTTRYTWQEVSP